MQSLAPLPPEEEELYKKRSELVVLQDQLGLQELELETLKAELARFHVRYLQLMGVKYAELDRLEAEIAGILANRVAASDPQRADDARARASEARDRAEQSKRDASAAQQTSDPAATFAPSDDLKRLYREVAKSVHPDLAADDSDRALRQDFMAQANEAYQAGDIDRLRLVLKRWQMSPHSVSGTGPGADLVRVIRQVAQVKDRLDAIAGELASLLESDLCRLKARVDEAQSTGRDLLEEMARELEIQISAAGRRLDELNASRD